MYSESNTTVEIQELLAVSAEYLGMGTDAVVACRDRSIEPFGRFIGTNRAPQRRQTVEQRCA